MFLQNDGNYTVQRGNLVNVWTWPGPAVVAVGVSAIFGGEVVPSIACGDFATEPTSLTVTLTGDTWENPLGEAVKHSIIAGFASTLTRIEAPTGFLAIIVDNLDEAMVERTSDTVITITFTNANTDSQLPNYDLDNTTETITLTIPAAALSESADPLEVTGSFDITCLDAAPALPGRGRRRRYQTPAPFPDALSASYATLVEAAPEPVVRKLIGEYILRGDVDPKALPPVQAVDWEALRADTKRVVELYDAWIEYVEDEDIAELLLLSDWRV